MMRRFAESGVSEGNGVDLGTIVAMLHGVLSAQETQGRKLDAQAARVDDQGRKTDSLATKLDVLTARVDDQGRKLDRLSGDVATLRQTVIEYHASVLGHGILISELDARLRRVEQHLNLPPAA